MKTLNTPSACLLQLNKECNLKCSHCSQSAPFNKNTPYLPRLSKDKWSKVFLKLSKIGMPRIEFTGGDPFIRPDFKEIYLIAKKYPFNISIVTNGLLLEENIDWLRENKPNKLRVSMYGATKKTYERSTGVKGSFHKSLKNIELAIQNDLDPTIVLLINNQNIQEMKNFIIDFEKKGAKKFRIIQNMSVGRSKKSRKKTLIEEPSHKQINDILDFLDHRRRKIDFKISLKSGDDLLLEKYNMQHDITDCKVDLNYLWSIDDTGEVYPCCLLMYQETGSIFNIIKDDIKNWNTWDKRKIFSKYKTTTCNFCPAKSSENDPCPLSYATPSK